MAKDPAVLFYTSDFLTGCALMSMAQRGKYITLLCLQHQQGHLSEEDMLDVCGAHDAKIWKKFKQDEDGLFYNERMDEEAEKRRNFIDKQTENGRKGGRPKKETQTQPIEKPEKTHGFSLGSVWANPNETISIENENDNELSFSILSNTQELKEGVNNECNELFTTDTDKDKKTDKVNNKKFIERVIAYLNAKLGTKYRADTENTIKHINARIAKGATFEDFKIVIDKKVKQWRDDPKMACYLRPDTLFGSKFEGYLNEIVVETKENKFGSSFDTNEFFGLALKKSYERIGGADNDVK